MIGISSGATRLMEDSHRWGCPDHGGECSFTCAILGFVS